jgi:hypothetical protein
MHKCDILSFVFLTYGLSLNKDSNHEDSNQILEGLMNIRIFVYNSNRFFVL